MEEKKECCCCCSNKTKDTPRDKELLDDLNIRLNKIIGQLNGIKNMLDENRYCGDIITQVSAVENALKSFGYIVLEDHLKSCVVDGIKNDKLDILDEAVELIKKLK